MQTKSSQPGYMINRSLTFRLFFLLTLLIFNIGCKNSQESKNNGFNAKQADEPIGQTDRTAVSSSTTYVKYILFYGNSLTAGYGLDEDLSFPSLIQDRIDSLGLNYKVINAGLSGETTAGGLGRINWVLNQTIDIFILELGGNDMLRGLSVRETENNLREIVDAVRTKYPDIPIIMAGMQAAPNMGPDYIKAFDGLYRKLANEMNLALIPSLLQNVGGIKSLNQADGIHPNAQGAAIVRDNVWEVLGPMLVK